METTTEKIVKGKETILDSEIVVRTQVELERHNNCAQLRLFVFLGDERKSQIDYIFTGRFDDWNSNLEYALDEAKSKWNLEVETTKVA